MQDNADHRTGFRRGKVLNRSFINIRRHTVVGVGDGGDDDEGTVTVVVSSNEYSPN